MTNYDTAKALWEEACRIHRRDLSAAVEDQDWNLCVRRSQEVVELALKAALRFLGYDYPKHHDVAPLFAEVAEKKNLPIGREAVADQKVWVAFLCDVNDTTGTQIELLEPTGSGGPVARFLESRGARSRIEA